MAALLVATVLPGTPDSSRLALAAQWRSGCGRDLHGGALVLITRATRHDKADLMELLESRGWSDADLNEGVAFIAREGPVAGCARLIEVAPQTVVVDHVLVREDRRGQGIGSAVMRAAMNSRGGSLFLCCHDPAISFYERLGFAIVDPTDLPQPVLDYFIRHGDYPSTPDHVHHFMRAR